MRDVYLCHLCVVVYIVIMHCEQLRGISRNKWNKLLTKPYWCHLILIMIGHLRCNQLPMFSPMVYVVPVPQHAHCWWMWSDLIPPWWSTHPADKRCMGVPWLYLKYIKYLGNKVVWFLIMSINKQLCSIVGRSAPSKQHQIVMASSLVPWPSLRSAMYSADGRRESSKWPRNQRRWPPDVTCDRVLPPDGMQ